MQSSKSKKLIHFFNAILVSLMGDASGFTLESGQTKDTIRFIGEITPSAVERLIEQINTSQIEKLIITSNGGNAESAIALSEVIQKHKITVIVDKYCFSSCANYVFLAAQRKALVHGSILGFHGGIDADSENQTSDRAIQKKITELQKRQQFLFRNTNFDSSFFQLSFELTKPEETEEFLYVLEGEKLVKRFSIDRSNLDESIRKASEFLANAKVNGLQYSIEYQQKSLSKRKVYFPSLATLEKYGVRGIFRYPYPRNDIQLRRLAKSIANDFKVIGDNLTK